MAAPVVTSPAVYLSIGYIELSLRRSLLQVELVHQRLVAGVIEALLRRVGSGSRGRLVGPAGLDPAHSHRGEAVPEGLRLLGLVLLLFGGSVLREVIEVLLVEILVRLGPRWQSPVPSRMSEMSVVTPVRNDPTSNCGVSGLAVVSSLPVPPTPEAGRR